MTPHWHEEVERRARERLPREVFEYVRSGSFEQLAAAEAREGWAALRFAPRVLRDVSEIDASVTLLGTRYASPVGVAPTSLQHKVHPDGELAMARACLTPGRPLVVSSNAGTTFAEIGATGVRWWLQAYLTVDRILIEPMLERAVAAGAGAVVLTVDTPEPGPKPGGDAVHVDGGPGGYGRNHPEAVRGRPGAAHATDLGPDDIARLHELTGLPVVVKGVLRPDDAQRCVDAGAAAVWVSNHGGRQLDRSITTAEALAAVVEAVGERGEVYVDGGLRSGLDVLAGLALGANACFLGRLPLYALVDGAEGVEHVLGRVDEELVKAMRLAGAATVADTRGILWLERSNAL